MANYVSPGVYTIEKDISEYAPSINTSIVGIVGFAGKGPTDKATLITSQNNLVNTFGPPSEDINGQGLEGSLEILEQTNSLYFVRAATADAADASATIPVGACPSVIVSGAPTNATRDEGIGVGSSITLKIQVYDNAGTAKFTDNNSTGRVYTIPAGTADSQGEALRKVIGGGLDADHVGVFFGNGATDTTATGIALSGAIVGSYAGSGASLGVSAFQDTAMTMGTSALHAVSAIDGTVGSFGVPVTQYQFASAVRVYGASVENSGAKSASYLVESLYPGAGYNGGTRTDGTASGNSITISNLGSQNFNINVNQDGTTAEQFKTSFVGSGSWIEDVINTGETNTKSAIIKGNLQKAGADATAAKLDDFTGTLGTAFGGTSFQVTTQYLAPSANADGTAAPTATSVDSTNGPRFVKLINLTASSLAGGNNGDAAGAAATTALIGNAALADKTGMQALDDPTINIGIALIPGIQTESVQNALITLAETTQNFLSLVSPPYAIGNTQAAIDWSNGKSTTTGLSRTSPINSSYAAIYWPWVKVFSTFDGIDRWLDPAIYGARQMAFTDTVADSWFAPAGFRRGRLTKPTEVEVKLNQGDRDSLYSGGNVVNPIVSFPQQGITIFGQRTTQRSPSALDRINVRRLMIYIRKVILAATQRFVFEPNDEFTWSQIEGVLNPFLDDIRRRRGITEFRVVCDESVNTPLRIDRNELWTKVLVKPTKTAEILIFEINLTNQSAQLGSL
jgi:phage tail sheath protein FI